MKRKDETKILAKEAFWKVLGTGEPPTVDRVNNWLHDNGHGRRDRAVINDVVKECWLETGERAQQDFALPGVSPEATTLFLKLHDDLSKAARTELADEREQITADAERRIDEARADAEKARDETREAKALQHQSAAAYEAIRGDRDQLRSDLDRLIVEGQRERDSHQADLIAANEERLQLAVRLEAMSALAEAEREAASREHRRQALEIDGLRLDVKARVEQARIAKVEIDAALQRERALAEQIRDLSGQIGSARGIETTLRGQVGELQAALKDLQEQHALLRAQSEVAQVDASRLRIALDGALAAHADCMPLDTARLIQLIAQAWETGAASLGKPVTKSDDEQTVMAERGERYARRVLKTLGLSVSA